MHRIKSPIFIFSLPRSGSTLLQRILMTHSEIASVAEPWILLPLIYAEKKSGLFSEYNQDWSSTAIEDFIGHLPEGKAGYQQELRKFILTLYSKHCSNGESYFLDKTPRYYLIIKEIIELFPQAKFIFLFRNPVEILSSILTSWCNKSLFKVHVYQNDLFNGPVLLAEGYRLHRHLAYRVDYKSLLEDPQREIEGICQYLEVPFEEAMLQKFPESILKGQMGDSIGTKTYSTISTNTLFKWNQAIDTWVLKKYFLHYINSLDKKVLEEFGYSKEALIQGLTQLSIGKVGHWKEWMYWFRGKIIVRFKLNLLLMRRKLKVYYS